MYQQVYYVPKSSGTLADSLLAYGLATILREVLRYALDRKRHIPIRVRIEDRGLYEIHLPEIIQSEWLESLPHLPKLAWPIFRKKALPEDLAAIDYNAVWEGIRKVNDLVTTQRQKGKINWSEVEELRDSLREKQPHRDVALLLGDYRMQVESIHNQAVKQWYDTQQASYQATNLRTILEIFAAPQTDIEKIARVWAKEVKVPGVQSQLTASQVYNPSMGKGQNRAKADLLAMGNEKNFWLVEYLKTVGLFVTAVPRAFSDEDMRKTYVLAPANIELGQHNAIFDRFNRTFDAPGTSPVKADIFSSLDYADAYLSYACETRVEEGDKLLDPNPRNSINGFYVATYILLSQNSFTAINLSFLGLPPWLKRMRKEDVLTIQNVIEEHRLIIRPLQEKIQESYTLLDSYRDFLTGHRSAAFFDFCAGYGEYVVRTLLDTTRIRQMRVLSLDEIFRRLDMLDENRLTAKDDLTIFTSTSEQYPGFHRIAYAIRNSTVIPQRQNANYKLGQRPGKSLYDVRYGLGNNLRRKTDNAQDFLEALAEFLQIYNAETVQVYENTGEQHRKQVRISDLDDIVALVKEYGPHLVCNMLVAYGYATAGTKGHETSQSDENAGNEDIENAQQGVN